MGPEGSRSGGEEHEARYEEGCQKWLSHGIDLSYFFDCKTLSDSMENPWCQAGLMQGSSPGLGGLQTGILPWGCTGASASQSGKKVCAWRRMVLGRLQGEEPLPYVPDLFIESKVHRCFIGHYWGKSGGAPEVLLGIFHLRKNLLPGGSL